MPVGETTETTEEVTDGLSGSQETPNDPQNAPETDAEFDAAAAEQLFGLTPGALADVKTAEEAIKVVAEFTDKTLIAGLGLNGATEEVEEEKPADKGDAAKAAAAAKGGNPELDALRAKLEVVETKLSKQEKERETAAEQEVQRRIADHIDGWKSPKYGVGNNRNFKQIKATKEMQQLVMDHARTLQATGQPIPNVSALLERLRVWDDDTYKPAVKKGDGKTALGSPGTSKELAGSGKDAPRNIHEVLARNPN